MKYKGKKLTGRNSDILVLMRGSDRVVFKAEAIDNFDEFDKLVSPPEPPIIMRKGGVRERNLEDPAFKERMQTYAEQKTNYLVIKSLSATEDLEWEAVKLNEPKTWVKWRDELKECGFTDVEVMRILKLVTRVNSLDDDMLDEAREAFLAEQLVQEK